MVAEGQDSSTAEGDGIELDVHVFVPWRTCRMSFEQRREVPNISSVVNCVVARARASVVGKDRHADVNK